MRPIFFALIAIATLAGCKSTDDFVGSGPLTVSPHITDYYREQYLKSPGPHYFVVSRHSRWAGYTACSNGLVGCSGDGVIFSVLNRCEERAGEPCHILDKWGSVVWKGPVTFGDGTTAGTRPDDAGPSARDSAAVADEDTARLCTTALTYKGGQPAWRQSPVYRKEVGKALERGMTPESCSEAVLATTPDRNLCMVALTYLGDQPKWQGWHKRLEVTEARLRGLSPEDCHELHNAPPGRRHRADRRGTQGASEDAGGAATAAAAGSMSTWSDEDVCRHAVSVMRGGPEWAGSSYGAMIREARKRGFTPVTCDRLVSG